MNESRQGWWTGARFANIGEGYFDASWASQALTQFALAHEGVTVFDNSLQGVLVKGLTFVQLVERFTALGGRVVFRSPPWRGDISEKAYLTWDDGFMALWINDGDVEGRVATTNAQLFADVQKLLESSMGPKVSSGRAYVLITTDEGPKLQSIGTAAVALERGNYNPDVLKDFDHVVSDLKSKDPSGRLAIFDGIPGTGKTYMICGLLSEVPDALFVLVQADLVQELASPGMISALLETRSRKGDLPTVFVIEDADGCLAKREDGNVNAVSALLNLGDGIIGRMMDIRLICTTNLKVDELDEAVTRPGRLSRKISVGPLDPEVAEALYKKLTGNKIRIDEKLTLAQVYSLARNDGWKPVQRKRAVGFQPTHIEETLVFTETMGLDEDDLSPSLLDGIKNR